MIISSRCYYLFAQSAFLMCYLLVAVTRMDQFHLFVITVVYNHLTAIYGEDFLLYICIQSQNSSLGYPVEGSSVSYVKLHLFIPIYGSLTLLSSVWHSLLPHDYFLNN